MRQSPSTVELRIGGKRFKFSAAPPFGRQVARADWLMTRLTRALHILSRNDVAGKPQMNTDEHRFGGKVSLTISQSASRKDEAERQDRKIDDRNMPMNRFPIFLHQPSTLNHQPRPERDPLRFICVPPPCSRIVAANLCLPHCGMVSIGRGNQARARGAAEPAR